MASRRRAPAGRRTRARRANGRAIELSTPLVGMFVIALVAVGYFGTLAIKPALSS